MAASCNFYLQRAAIFFLSFCRGRPEEQHYLSNPDRDFMHILPANLIKPDRRGGLTEWLTGS
jgi:hypothetical protein